MPSASASSKKVVSFRLGGLENRFEKEVVKTGLKGSEIVRRALINYFSVKDGAALNAEKSSSLLFDNTLSNRQDLSNRKKFDVRLSEDEINLLTEIKESIGIGTIQELIISIIRANISNQIILTEDEIKSLNESNFLMRRIGQLLNTIVKNFHQDYWDKNAQLSKDKIESLATLYTSHVEEVNKLIKQSRVRLKIIKGVK